MSGSLGGAAAGHQRTALASIAAAMFLVALKLGTGIATGSLSLISAGIESSGDVIAAVLTFLAVRLGGRPADEDHPYGHRRAENLAALGEAAILIGAGVFVVIAAVGQLIAGGEHLEARWYVFAVIAVAICIDLSRILVSLRTAEKYDSAALRSNAFHFGADLAGSLAVLGGLVLVAAGVAAGDAIAALVVACVIFAAAGRLIYENARVLMDTTPQDAYAQALSAVADAAPGVEVQRLRVRESGGRYFADVVVGVPPAQPVLEGHQTADAIEQAVHSALPNSDVVVHVEPGGRDLSLREEILAIALAAPAVREVHDVNVFERNGGAIVTLHVKFDRDVPLTDAHRVGDRIEDQLRELPGVTDARTHLEPIEPAGRAAHDSTSSTDLEQQIRQLVQRTTGQPARDLRALQTRSGLVVLLTAAVNEQARLRDAHTIAGQLEQTIRRDHPDIVEVVVHTEPGPTPTIQGPPS
ncbi:MAG: cation transporter [Solirubrobacterales bacterium]|nr:cation transporter [Solirubrobacterales bacterium]